MTETERDERDAKFFHDGWMAALREVRIRSDRQIGEFLVEQLGEAQAPVPECGDPDE